LQDAPRELLDRGLRARVVVSLDERKSAGAPGLAIERHAHTADLYSLRGEGLTKLLLVDVIREIADEKTRAHPA